MVYLDCACKGNSKPGSVAGIGILLGYPKSVQLVSLLTDTET